MHTSADRAAVAKKAGVAESTVSRALADSPLISAQTKLAVRAAAQALGYIPNRQAAIFATQKTRRLAIVVPVYAGFSPFSRAFFPALLDGAVLAAEKKGYTVSILLDRVGGQPKDLSQIVSSREADGLLFSMSRASDPRISRLQKDGVPFVLTNTHEPDCNCVDNNPQTGMRKAFEYVRSMGHCRIGYVAGDKGYHNAVERLETFQSLAREFALESVCIDGDFSRTSGYYCAAKLLRSKHKPTLIMTASDRSALGVLQYCRDHGIAVPDALSIIGYDNLGPSEFFSPSLTTIDNPIAQIGAASADLLIDYIENRSAGPVCRKLDTDFVIRESSGPRVPQTHMKRRAVHGKK